MVSSVNSDPQSLLTHAISSAKKYATSAAAAPVSSTASDAGNAALSSLGGNFNQFLTLLTTQLQHQDPSSPTNTDNFTSELAQFAGVQQQVQTNSHLSNLISATQDTQMTAGLNIIGHMTKAQSSSLPLQNHQGNMTFQADQAGTVAVAVTDTAGRVVKTDVVSAHAGANGWSWNGVGDDGRAMPDGHYLVAVDGVDPSGAKMELPTTVTGVVTGLTRSADGVRAQMGAVSVPLSQLNEFSGT